jgi:hypothetical protein
MHSIFLLCVVEMEGLYRIKVSRKNNGETLTVKGLADLSLRRVYLLDSEKLIETSGDAEMNPKFVVDLF